MKTDTVTTSTACRKTLWLLLTIIVLQTTAQAQDSDSSRGPVSIGVNYQQLVPRGEFRENTRGAPLLYQGALGVDLIFHLRSAVNLRLDYLFGMYDKSPGNGWGGVSYSFRGGGVAGELVLPRGPVRPYVTAGLGRVSLSSFEYPDGTKADTGAGYWMYGGGVKLLSKTGWSWDLAARYHNTGPVSYQHAIRYPDGSVAVATTRNDTAFVMCMAGLQYRFGGRN